MLKHGVWEVCPGEYARVPCANLTLFLLLYDCARVNVHFIESLTSIIQHSLVTEYGISGKKNSRKKIFIRNNHGWAYQSCLINMHLTIQNSVSKKDPSRANVQ